jgi:hypothetical protein
METNHRRMKSTNGIWRAKKRDESGVALNVRMPGMHGALTFAYWIAAAVGALTTFAYL